jgi:hypothetical protein
VATKAGLRWQPAWRTAADSIAFVEEDIVEVDIPVAQGEGRLVKEIKNAPLALLHRRPPRENLPGVHGAAVGPGWRRGRARRSWERRNRLG